MNKNNSIRIATRKSRLALWQANWIKTALEKVYPHLSIILCPISTTGDEKADLPLTKIGGKSVFVKTLQTALLNNEADIAVHCVKDMSVHATPGLTIAAICEREDPRDAFLSHQAETLELLKPNAIIGTGSPRRTALIKSIRPDCEIHLLRGNVDTRIAKLNAHEYDAIVLAAAGLHRLGLSAQIQSYLLPSTFVPAIGQGALAIECRSDDAENQDRVAFLHDEITAHCIAAEKAVNQVLHGDCYTPVGAHATVLENQLLLSAVIGSLDGSTILRSEMSGLLTSAEKLGHDVARDLLNQGASEFINKENAHA